MPIDEIAKLITTLLPPLVDLFFELLDAIPLDLMIDFVVKAMGPIMQILTALMHIATPLIKMLEPLLNILMVILDVLQPIIDGITWVMENVTGKILGGVSSFLGGLFGGGDKNGNGDGGGDKNGKKMAAGGIVTGPTRALIGEAGPEAVIPLHGGGLGGDVFNITVEGNVWAMDELTERLRYEFIKIKTDNTTTGF